MRQLSNLQTSRLKKIIEKFPELTSLATNLNQAKICWSLAAGSAYFVYTGDKKKVLDEVDVWVSQEDKEKVSNILGVSWEARSSERHRAENIELGPLDVFTNCKKVKNGKQLLDYRWTEIVTNHRRKTSINGVEYPVIPPEDIVLLKIANPRGKKERDQIKTLSIKMDRKYFAQRTKECKFKATRI